LFLASDEASFITGTELVIDGGFVWVWTSCRRSRLPSLQPTAGNDIHSGARHPHFGKVLSGLISESQGQRIQAALATLHSALSMS
jgi:hypothetical protein